jgi:hypothetical protein
MGRAIYDNLLLLKDAGAVTGDGAGTVGGQPRVVDVGNASIGDAKMVVDTSAIDVTTGDETYRVMLQGSNVVDFSSGVVELGSVVINASGRMEVPVSNERGQGVYYRYLRAYNDVGGTTPSINSTIFLTKA